jgi:integrase
MSPDDVRRLLEVTRDRLEVEQRSRRRQSRQAERDYLLIVTALNAGLRAAELAALRVGDLRLEEEPPRLIVRGGKARKASPAMGHRQTDDLDEVLLRYDVARLLAAWVKGRGPDEPVFPSQRDGDGGARRPLSRRGVWRIVKALMKKAGLNPLYTAHALRHRFVMAEIEAQERQGELDPHLLARRSRHRSLNSALRYIHFRASRVQAHLEARESEM